MSKQQNESLRVTDHAVIRYMERAMDLNIEVVRDHIAAVCRGAAGMGATCIRAEGVRFEITNGTVITVRPDGVTPSKTDRDRNQHRIERKKREIFESRPTAEPDRNSRHGGGIVAFGTGGVDPGPAGFPADFDPDAYPYSPIPAD